MELFSCFFMKESHPSTIDICVAWYSVLVFCHQLLAYNPLLIFIEGVCFALMIYSRLLLDIHNRRT